MSAAEITALFAGIASVGAMLLSLRNGLRASKIAEDQASNAIAVDGKLQHITLQVNSRLAEVVTDLNAAVTELRESRVEIASLRERLATVTGHVDLPAGPSPLPIQPPETPPVPMPRAVNRFPGRPGNG